MIISKIRVKIGYKVSNNYPFWYLSQVQNQSKVFLAGHKGMLGSAILSRLSRDLSSEQILLADGLDLRDAKQVDDFFSHHRPSTVINAAATVGGIKANFEWPLEFLVNNLQIELAIQLSSWKYDVDKTISFGSSTMYSTNDSGWVTEEQLGDIKLDKGTRPYALAKFVSLELSSIINEKHKAKNLFFIPSNMYGPGDNFNLVTGHAVANLLWKFKTSKQNGDSDIVIWGKPDTVRDFVHVDDVARAVVLAVNIPQCAGVFNVSTGIGTTLEDLIQTLVEIFDSKASICWDKDQPTGSDYKVLSNERLMSFGWSPLIDLRQGLTEMKSYIMNNSEVIRSDNRPRGLLNESS